MMQTSYSAAVDLGTGYVRVYTRGRGLVVDEPSVVRVSRRPLTLRAIGAHALHPLDGIKPTFMVHPLSKGVVVDVEAAGWLLSMALRRARGLYLTQPRVMACLPSDVTNEEGIALREALARAGAASVTILPEPLAAASGAGLDVGSPYAQLVVDVGEGVTDVAVIREGCIEQAGAVRTACADVRQAVIRALLQRHGILLPPAEAQRVIDVVGVGEPEQDPATIEIRGLRIRDMSVTNAVVERQEVVDAVQRPVEQIVGAVSAVWRKLTPETSCEVIESGINLTGGGACLRGLADRLADATTLDVRVAKKPMHSVVLGAGRMASLL